MDRFLVAGPIALNALALMFLVMVARMSSPDLYGAFIALLGVLMVFEAPASALQAAIARTVDSRRRSAGTEPRIATAPLITDALVGAVMTAAALLVAAIPLGRLLHVGAGSIGLLVAAYAVPVGIGVVPKGMLAGYRYTGVLWTGLLLGVLVRLGVGTVLVHSGWGIRGAMGSVVLGELVTAGFLLLAMHRRFPATPAGESEYRLRWSDAGADGIAFTGFWALAGLDVVLARHYLPGASAGLYGAASTLAQISMVCAGPVAALLIGRLAAARRNGAGGAAPRRWPAVVVVTLSVAALSVPVAFPSVLPAALFGPRYSVAGPVVVMLALSGVALGVIAAAVRSLLVRGARLPACATWLGVVAISLTVKGHPSAELISTACVVSTSSLAAVMVAVLLHSERYRHVDAAAPPDLGDVGAEIDLTVVVPYYNPGPSLRNNIEQLVRVLDGLGVSFEVIAVSDGCTDGSQLSLADLGDARVANVVLPRNQGKGAALRVGLAAGRGRYLGFIDADGDIDPHLLNPFVALIRLYRPEIIMGSKRHPLSEVDYPPVRLLYSIGYQLLVKVLFNLNVRDTQTGLKLVRRDVLAAVLPRMLERRFAFDLELLVVARRLGYRRVLEAPVLVRRQFSSTVSFRSVLHTMSDTLAIVYRARLLRYYDRAQSPGTDPDMTVQAALIQRGGLAQTYPGRSRRSPRPAATPVVPEASRTGSAAGSAA